MSHPIAIVGVSVELPSGSYSTENLDHKSFFDFLLASGEAYEETPSGRFNIEAWKGTGVGKVHVNRGAFLKDIDTFDNVEFGISSKDAQAMAPATRKILENSFLALLDSGIDYRMKKVGCFTSGTSIDLMNVSEPDEFDSRGSFAGYPSMIANRISNHLDLLGPSFPVDTACSSTLTAMHLAVQAITHGDCEAAVVGGCQLNHRFVDWITYSQGSLLAKDGKCKPFDGAADGFARAEACAVVVIKPLEDALRDRDHIYATILGTAINSIGSAAPPGAPVAESQRDAMIQAFERAGKNPREVDYVELHATGTAKGDPTETNWVGEHFHRDDELLVGSVKANIGHTEIVAFLASLSKVISIFERKIVPPQINISQLNPGIKWEEYRLKVPMEPTPLSVRSRNKSLVSIAGSGIGGSNGHVVLESPPLFKPYSATSNVHCRDNSPVLIMIGGLSSRAATAASESIQNNLSLYQSDLPGLSTVLGRRAKQATWRAYAIAGAGKSDVPEFSAPEHCPRTANSLIYVFSGQGPQHKDMGRELFEKFPVFRQSILEMDAVFRKSTGKSIIQDYGLFDQSSAPTLPEIWPIALVLPSIAIFQIALFDLLVSLGMKPDAVVGHSAGETAVLYASGAAPKAMAVELAIIRGRSFTPIEKLGGTMAAVECTAQVMEEILLEYRKEHPQCLIEVACFNSPSAVAIAGEESAVDAVVGLANARSISARKLRTKVPFHSSMMEISKDVYCSALKDLFERYPGPHSPKTSTFSTITGALFEGSFDADYFWTNTRSAVRFTETIEAIRAASPNATFVELAPHPVLGSYIMNMSSETSTVLHCVQRPKRGSPSSEQLSLLRLCGKVTVAGHNCVDFTALNGRECSEFTLPLPAYPFVRKKYPLYPDTPGVMKQMETPRGPLNHAYLRLNKETHPTLAEHVIRGEPIMPAAGYLEMALEFGATTLMNVNLRSILSLSSEKPVKVDIELDGAFWTIKSFSSNSKSRKDVGPGSNGRLHADGYLSFEIPKAVLPLDIKAVRKKCTRHIGSDFYPSLSYFSSYGTRFQRVTNMYFNANEALASIKGMDSTLASDGKYLLHPAILDACIQVTAHKPFHGDYDPNVYYLPSHVDAIIVHQRLKTGYFPVHLYAHVELKKWKPASMQYDICLVDDSGVRLCTFVGLEVAKHYINPVSDASRPLQVIMQPVFHSPRIEVKDHHHHTDRSDLFATLDKVAIRTKISINAGHATKSTTTALAQNERWSSYFEKSDSDKAILPSEGPHFDQAIMCSMNSLRNALSSFNNSEITVVQILVASVVKSDLFRVGIEEVIREFPSLYVNLFVDNKHTSQPLPTVTSGIVRNTRVDVSGPNSGIEDQLFDVVFFFNVVDGRTDPRRTIETAHSLLVPGGTFILTEKNLEAWDMGSLGTTWYDSKFGAPTSGEIHRLASYLELMENFNVLGVHNSKDADPFHFCVESQKSAWTMRESPGSPLFDPSESFVYEYTFGNELELQWELSGLNTAQSLDIWLTATQGRDGDAAQGLARAMRREYVSWTIRLVVFPLEYDDEMRQEFLENLPLELRYEQDIVVSSEDSSKLLVPRIVPVPRIESGSVQMSQSNEDRSVLLSHQVLLRPLSFSKQGTVTGVFASIVDGKASGLREGDTVVGLVDAPIEELMVVDVATLARIPSELAKQASMIPALIPGFITAVLAPGLSTFSRPCRLRNSRVLLTHADTVAGSNVTRLSTKNGLQIERIPQQTSLYDLAKLHGQPYDLIISGYTDQAYIQILQTLLDSRHGKLFLWNDDTNGLPGILRRDPFSISDALRHSFAMIDNDVESFQVPANVVAATLGPEASIKRPSELSNATSFNQNKTYIILGGIGTIGAHLALFMYQRGARHIILTSRSGKKSLDVNTNLVVRRMFEYLEKTTDLQLNLLAVDATDASAMKSMLVNVGQRKLGGCILLTAVLADGIFHHLQESDFSTVFSAKLGAFETLKEVLDLDLLDFIVSFTSVSGLFGFGGQTNYGAANTALEGEMSRLSNGFSFVCPGILDSTLMLAGTGKDNESRLSGLIPWSVSAQDMIQWFDDSMCRFQNGQRIARYVPELNWEALERTQRMPRLGRHLLPNEAVEDAPDMDDSSHMSRIVRNVLDIPEADFSFDVPLTAYGIDSLSASRISFLLRPYVEVTQIQLLGDLSLSDLLRSSQTDVPAPTESQKRPKAGANAKAELMGDMLAKYSRNTKDTASTLAVGMSPPSISHHDEVVLITGTTGTLGSNILAQLLQNSDITIVYALNRVGKSNNPILQRQRCIFSRQGLPLSLLDSPKLVLLEGDLLSDDFNLPKDIANKLLSSVTHIIHNAWAVDFATTLEEHEDLIKGTRNLLDFARHSTLAVRPTVSFISTIGIYQHPNDSSVTEAPELPVLDPKVSVQGGYTESKWVAERLFQLESENHGLSTNVIRVGLLSGGRNGCWDPSQWFPAIAQSATYLGCLPEGDDLISWIPVDLAAAAIVDMRDTENETLHLVHPKPVKWNDVMQVLATTLGVPLVPYVEWVARLESSANDSDENGTHHTANRRAALKLTHFYRIGLNASSHNTESMGLLPKVATAKAVKASPKLQDETVQPLNEHDVKKWVAYWREIGFLYS